MTTRLLALTGFVLEISASLLSAIATAKAPRHSPAAELRVGIRLVIATSFERIYRQNADNLGLFTSTDFGLIERIQRGENIAIDELVSGRDALTAAVLQAGGLLRYGQQHLQTKKPLGATLPGKDGCTSDIVIAAKAAPTKNIVCRDESILQTLTEKILSRHVVATANTTTDIHAGNGIFIRADLRFIHDIYTTMCAHSLHETVGRPLALPEPETILTFEDHYSYAHKSVMHVKNGLLPNVRALSDGHRAFVRDNGLKDDGYLPAGEGSTGISHALMAERYSLPCQVVVGTDSHTTQRCAGLSRVRRRQHRHGQRDDDRRDSYDRAAVALHRA